MKKFDRPSDESRDSEGVDPEIKIAQAFLKSRDEAMDKYFQLKAEYEALQTSSSDSGAIGAKLGESVTAYNSYIQAQQELDIIRMIAIAWLAGGHKILCTKPFS